MISAVDDGVFDTPTPFVDDGVCAPGLVADTTTADFRRDVLDHSRTVPVLVYFWAPWCGPCAGLGPVLDQVAADCGPALRIVKVNVDNEPDLAARFGVQSIPGVYAVVDGSVVDGFTGALPESQVRAFVSRVVPTPRTSDTDALLEKAEGLLGYANPADIKTMFEQVLSRDPENPRAQAGVFRCRIAMGDEAAVRSDMRALPESVVSSAPFEKIHTILEITAEAGSAEHLRKALGRLALDPGDHQARLDIARAFFAKGDVTSATDHLIESLKRDPTWNESAARRQLLKIWDVLGPNHPSTIEGRRRLSAILFS